MQRVPRGFCCSLGPCPESRAGGQGHRVGWDRGAEQWLREDREVQWVSGFRPAQGHVVTTETRGPEPAGQAPSWGARWWVGLRCTLIRPWKKHSSAPGDTSGRTLTGRASVRETL